MTKFEELQLELSNYSYRPGWEFKLEVVTHAIRWQGHDRVPVPDVVGIVVTAQVADVNPPHEVGPVMFTQVLSWPELLFHPNPGEYLRQALRAAIWNVEKHEFDEWFKYQGKCVTDPHPELANAAS